jgi:hypothetical protein
MAIKHARGLRQGDPLSPLLFILAIDPLQRIIEVAATKGILNPILPKAAKLRCSLYANETAIFASPNNLELQHLHGILNFLGIAQDSESKSIKNRNLPHPAGA